MWLPCNFLHGGLSVIFQPLPPTLQAALTDMAPSHVHNELLSWALATEEQCLFHMLWAEAPGLSKFSGAPGSGATLARYLSLLLAQTLAREKPASGTG